MPFHRFDKLQSHHFNPHLSSTRGPILEGRYLYFRRVHNAAGTGADLHYHPNELIMFPLAGTMAAVVGKERRIVAPGTLVHVPPCARHEARATEDADLSYLYAKDKTWGLVGVAADEALPSRQQTPEEVRARHARGEWAGGRKAPKKSGAIVEGLGECYHPMIAGFDAPPASGRREQWVEGMRLAFGFCELPAGAESAERASAHEMFGYIVSGRASARVGRQAKALGPGDVFEVPRGASYRLLAGRGGPVRFAAVRSTARGERETDAAAKRQR